MARQRLSWFLFKSNVTPDDGIELALDPSVAGTLLAYRVDALDPDQELLYVKPSHPVQPRWVQYVEPHIGTAQLPGMMGASSAGVLFIPSGRRLLVVTFGYGRFLLRQEALVQDFGLKVVLNTVDPGQIKSVDARTFDELTVHTRRGVSRDSAFSAFGLDVSRDLLRGITGTSASDGLAGALTGASALTMTTPLQVPELDALADTLLKAYRAKRYQKNGFAFIDYMRAERDPTVLSHLDDQLVQALEAGDLTDMHLAIPEAIDWQEVAGVRFSFKKRKHEPTPDPKISLYRELRADEEIAIARLKSDRVEAISAVDDQQLRGRWAVYDCVVFETDYNGHLYVLSGGDWYRIKKSYRDEVEAFARTLPELDVGLPSATTGDDESAYNVAAATTIDALALDGHLISVGGPDRVELCDLLTRDGIFIHVKKRGRSSTLSHLFAQGITSTQMLLHDQTFLSDATDLVSSLDDSFEDALPDELGARDQVKVAYVIVSRGQRPDKPFGLPFFSLVSLQAAARQLQNAGVELFVQEIKEI